MNTHVTYNILYIIIIIIYNVPLVGSRLSVLSPASFANTVDFPDPCNPKQRILNSGLGCSYPLCLPAILQ